MVNRNLLLTLDPDEKGWDEEINLAFDDVTEEELAEMIAGTEDEEVLPNKIIDGKVVRVDDDQAVIDIGYKCEATVPINEWDEDEDPPQIGHIIKVLVEDIEDTFGQGADSGQMLLISKKKAEKALTWQRLMETTAEGDVVTGKVTRQIKGGLLVDIGVPVFLPASQVDIRRPPDIGDYVGRFIQGLVLKIDETRHNIVVSRRALIEEERQVKRQQLLATLKVDERRKGIVKNIASFGAFVDLGGIDGLLHITDMAWTRVNHPTEVVTMDQEIEVVVLSIDHQNEKISLGLKQKSPSPWDNVEEKYPVGSKIEGEVVNVVSYGAFVKLEDGIEGLVHISEMSWVQRVTDPGELVTIGDKKEVVVLGINKQKQEISLGMKQTQDNPWDKVANAYPAGSMVKGKVRNLTNYGAFIEIEEGIDGLLHVSDMSWVRKISHPSEMVNKGMEVECKVLTVDQDRRRIALGLKQLTDDPWATDIPSRYHAGQVVTGTVTKITNFGVFVSLDDEEKPEGEESPDAEAKAAADGEEGDGLEGLLHISELADHKVENPEEVVKVGEKIDVKILRVDVEDRKIGLSRKRVEWAEEDQAEAEAAEAKAVAAAQDLKGGVGDTSGPLIQPISAPEEPAEVEAVAESGSDAEEPEKE